MTDVRITGVTRAVHRDGPGPLRVARLYRVVHRDPATNPTQVRVVRVYREVMYQSHVPVQFTQAVALDLGISPSLSRQTGKTVAASVQVNPQLTRGITLAAIMLSVQAVPGLFKTFPRTFAVSVGITPDLKLHHHAINFIRGIIDRLGLRGIIDAILPVSPIRAFTDVEPLAGVVDNDADASVLHAVFDPSEARGVVED